MTGPAAGRGARESVLAPQEAVQTRTPITMAPNIFITDCPCCFRSAFRLRHPKREHPSPRSRPPARFDGPANVGLDHLRINLGMLRLMGKAGLFLFLRRVFKDQFAMHALGLAHRNTQPLVAVLTCELRFATQFPIE